MKTDKAHLGVFYHLLGNTLLAGVTNNTVWFALIFYIYLETQSVMATSIISGMYLIAVAVSGFWFGGLVDRYRKKHVMIASALASLLIYAVGDIIYTAAPEGAFTDVAGGTLWALVVLLLAGVLAGNTRGIALPTLITLLIAEDERDRANGLAGTAGGIAFLVTSAISGFLVGYAGMTWVLILAMGMTAVTMAHLVALPLAEGDPTAANGGEPVKVDLRGTVAVITAIPGLTSLILFSTLNNLLGGVYMGLMDAYGLSLVSVQVWGILWAVLSGAFIVGGLLIAKWGLGKNPLATMFIANVCIWLASALFAIQSSVVLLTAGMLIYMTLVPYIEASERMILQRLVPQERQGRVFGFAQSVELAASPLTTLLIGPFAQLVLIPFMTTGAGVDLIGGWFGTGADRGLALAFTLTGVIGFVVTLIAMRTRVYRLLSDCYSVSQGTEQQPGEAVRADLRACEARHLPA
jgi:DHA3 family multidrug efflux protein-like MFS transporter